MSINNGFNILPWYDSLEKQNSKKWYTFGQSWPLACPQNIILPFQFVSSSAISIESNIYAVSLTDGTQVNLGIKPEVIAGTQAGSTYYIVKQPLTSLLTTLPVGHYYFRMNTNVGQLYSEEVTVVDNITDYIKIEYWNEDTLNFTSGEINFDDDFKFVMYIPSTIGKPEYEFEEELTKRLGYKFIESQTSNKIYKFNFLAPEYICDAMRLIRLCDYIKLTTKYDTFNALSFAYEPKWQDNGDLAAVDVEFDTDCIIQKLESFNRRLKESFYNALLADIDEPVLFSTDTVAQYYTEFTTTSYINGKLIRQLEAISEDELSQSINDIVLPIDNQLDTNRVAKKVFLSNIINKFAPQVDLSKYLLKSVWDSVFELRDDIETGKKYIYGKLPVVLQYGLTMYSGDGVDIPSIYEGLPIDNDTIYWKDGILKAKAGTEGAITEITSSMITSALGYTPYDASNPNGYITSAALSNYALSSDVEAVSTKLNDFLEGSDTDNIINKWKELEIFLSGLSQSDNLATILGNKAEKTDLAKYIPIAGETDITGEKNFIGGLKINGSPIYYDTEKKYWKLEGDLLVTGGVTIYGNEGTYTPSTIMDAILYDDTTLGINAQGQLYVKGGTGGGGISSVTSQMIVDALGYTPASAIALSGYLPLSGGIIERNDRKLLLLRNTDSEGASTLWFSGDFNTYSEGAQIAYNNKQGSFTFGNHKAYTNNSKGIASIRITSDNKIQVGDINFTDGYVYDIWHAGNDGSGSGLDADLLDGIHLWNGQWNSIPKIGSDGVMEIGKYIDFHHATSIVDYSVRIISPNIEGVSITLPSASGTLALTSSNVASATKLATARTIWGQSFDGTGNITGKLTFSELNGNAPTIQFKNGECIDAYGNVQMYKTENTWSVGLNYSPLFCVTGSGNVGIGMPIPTQKLHVAGNIALRDNLLFGSGALGNHTVPFNETSSIITWLATNGNKLGYVGYYIDHFIICNYKDSVERSGFSFFDNGDIVSFDNCNLLVKGIITAKDSFRGNYSDSSKQYISLHSNGNTYIKTPSEIYLQAPTTVQGNLLTTGGVTMYSDIRKKTKIKDVVLSLQQVANAPLIEHYYNSDQNKTIHVGSIAQYWAEMNDWFCKKDSEGYYTMEIQNAALASAISVARELVKFETETDRRIRLLEEENKRLKEEVEYLKLNVA